MSDTDFYNRNMYRRYPFVEDPPDFPADHWMRGVVDVGVVLLPDSGFDPSDEDHKIYPDYIYKSGVTTVCGLRIVAAGTNVHNQTIVASADDVGRCGVIPFAFSLSGEQVAFGFVVIGDDSDFPASAGGASIGTSSSYLERRCIQVLDGHYVKSLDLVNEPRIVASNRCPEMSSSSSSPSSVPERSSSSSLSGVPEGQAEGYPYAPGGRGMVGNLRFMEGLNADINVIANASAIRFSARRGAGLGEPCEEVPRTAEEQERIDNGLTLDRAVRCNEVFNNINGVTPDNSGNFSLIAKRGVEITSPSDHHILIAGREDLEDCTP